MIEHTDVEVVEEPPTDPPPPPPEHAHERPSIHDVIVAAIVQRLPCPVCSRTEPCRCVTPDDYSPTVTRANLIEQALIHYGYLDDPEQRDVFNAEETAQWLANRSGFPRYTQVEDGWKRLLESEIDVDLAAIKATQRVPADEVNMVKAAKAALLSWHQSQSV